MGVNFSLHSTGRRHRVVRATCFIVCTMLMLAGPLKSAAAVSSALWAGIITSIDTSEFNAYENTERKATQMLDAWAAYLFVTSSVSDDTSNAMRQRYRKLAVFLAVKAIKQNSPEALTLMFSRDDVQEFNELKTEYVGRFLSMAELSEGVEKDKLLLITAGDVLEQGRLATQDSLRAAGMYTRAWAAGASDAAGKLSTLFWNLKDPASAYLWGLRCLKNCHGSHHREEAKALLTPRQIQWIQTQARDHSVITVNGLSAMKETR